MARIMIPNSPKNLMFAATVRGLTGAQFEEDGHELYIMDSPILEIPREAFDQFYNFWPNFQLQEKLWQSLLTNKDGYLHEFSPHAIVLGDQPPDQSKFPKLMVRFPSEAALIEADEHARCLGFPSLSDYILAAVEHYQCCQDVQLAE